MIAYLFPGQGSQQKGMGAGLFDIFQDLTEKTDAILGHSIQELCLDDPDHHLDQTAYAQPALYVVNAFSYLHQLARRGGWPAYLAGHSLGEYNALFAAGAFDFETGLRLVKRRAELMAQTDVGGMMAVVGASFATIQETLADQDLTGIDIAGLNTPTQTVISGPRAELALFERQFQSSKTVTCVPLRVSAAFHSRYMADARNHFAAFLETLRFSEIRIPVIANATAMPYQNDRIRQLLCDQMTHSVRWEDTVRYLSKQGNIQFEEIGPGRVLTGLVKQIQQGKAPGSKCSSMPSAVALLAQCTDPKQNRPLVLPNADHTERSIDMVSKASHVKKDRSQIARQGTLKADSGAADIAIIGMACRFPGADNYHQFWYNLEHGINSIREITPDRWDTNLYYSPDINEPNKSISKWCGLIDDIDKFDNTFFKISPREAKNMDPQQRLLLEETWHCIEDSGVAIEKLRSKRTAVYIGVMASDYRQEASRPGVFTDSYAASGNYDAMLANRISYAFGFSGASVSVDTACASSLVAINGAKRSLLIGESDFAIAGGVSLNLHPWKYLSFSKARMLSPDGQCKTFDAEANGYVPGEGIGVLLLQRLEDAQLAGNRIYGIIKGCAVNHGGRTQSLTAPRVEAQRDVILLAYQEANISPETVSYVEAHGTGTSLGDPIEVEALTRAFRRFTDKSDFCKIGSVKPNIGHLEAAAGVAGVVKVLMMMQHRKIPKNLNIKSINPIIQFENSPFSVAMELGDWDPKTGEAIPLRAGVSSFGMGGVNAHIVLEQPPAADPGKDTRHGQLFILSAKTRSSLNRMLTDWKSFVASEQFNRLNFKDICWTMLTGRDSFPIRFGIYAKDKKALKGMIAGTAQSAVAVQPSEKFYCLRIGSLKIEGYSRIRHLLRHETIFSECLKEIRIDLHKLTETCQSFEDLNRLQELASGFEEDDWPSASQPVYAFMVNYAYAAALIKIGAAPGLITGGKEGALAGLASCGILRPIDVLALLTQQMKPHDLSPRRPKLPYIDPVSGKIIEPFRFSGEYIRFIRNELHLDPDLLEYYLEKGQLLFNGQFTFKRYMQDWNTVLEDKGKTVEQMLYDQCNDAPLDKERKREKLLMMVIIISSLHKLRLKWDLTQQKPIVDRLLGEVVDLIVDGVMGKEILVQLFMDDQPDFGDMASALSKNYHQMDLSKPYHYIRTQNRCLKEIDDVPAWLNRLTSSTAPLPQIENMVCVDLGESGNAPKEINTVSFRTSRDLDRSFKEFLLQLWLQGVHIEWRKIFPEGQFNKVSLPGYAFDRKSFWLSSLKFKSAEKLFLNQNLTKQQDDHSACHPECTPGEEKEHMAFMAGKSGRTQNLAKDQQAEGRPVSRMAPLLNRTERFLLELIGRLIDVQVEEIDPNAHLSEYGVDSIMIQHFNVEMENYFNSISKTLLVEHPTIQAVAGYLVRHHKEQLLDLLGLEKEDDGASGQPQKNNPALPYSPADGTNQPPAVPCDGLTPLPSPDREMDHGIEDIAIIGLSGRYPQANTVDDFWDVLKTGTDCIGEIPRERWHTGKSAAASTRDRLGGGTDCQWGGFLDEVDQFDPLFFHISPKEAELMDPQERLFLEAVWNALEDGGYTKRDLRRRDGGKVGVFVGVTHHSYQLLGPMVGQDGRMEIPVSSSWSIANRVSYLFDFKGPSVPVDTGCASSLTAIHLACQSIKSKECALAVAGGVNLYFHPSRYALLGQLNMLSPSGKCHSFGKKADGFVPGEGVGAVLLKPLAKAVQDRDNIYAVIKSTAVRHNGRSNGYMTPNAAAQAELIVDALEKARIQPQTISYIETQSVGSPLGDPAEISGLTKAFHHYTQNKQFCAVGSVKTNIGHPEAASGIAGLTKVLLQMKHKSLVPSLHSDELNPDIDFKNSPFYVQGGLTPWRPVNGFDRTNHTPPHLRAGISAFGAGGSIAHIIVEAYDDAAAGTESLSTTQSPQLIVLSAKNERCLKRYAQRLSAFLEKFGSDPDRHLSMANIAYTLQVGRECMDARMAVIADNRRDLCRQLVRFAKTDAAETLADEFYSNLEPASADHLLQDFAKGQFGKDFIELVTAHLDLQKLALLWVSGAEIPWNKIHKERTVRRVSLPTYPFDRQRYWVCAAPGASTVAGIADRSGSGATAMAVSTHENRGPAPDPTGQRLVQWISELLKIPANLLEKDRNLREYGFNSLAGMRLIHRIEERFEVRIQPSKLFEHQTIAALTQYLAEVIDSSGRDDTLTIDAQLLSTAEQRMEKDRTGMIDVDRLTDREVDALIALLLKPRSEQSAAENFQLGKNDTSPEQLSA